MKTPHRPATHFARQQLHDKYIAEALALVGQGADSQQATEPERTEGPSLCEVNELLQRIATRGRLTQ